MNDDTGSTGVDETPQEDSPSSESQDSQSPSENQSEDSGLKSSEDKNTQPDDKNQVDDQKPVGLKGQQRFQKLANENRELSRRETIEQRRNQALTNMRTNPQNQGYQQPVTSGATPEVPTLQTNPLATELLLQKVEMQRIQDERELDRAAKKYPELDVDSESYDSEFHDLVWNISQSEGVSLSEAADKAQRWGEKVAQKAIIMENEVNENKAANSNQGGQRRTVPASTEMEQKLQKARSNFANSRSWEDLRKIRELEYSQQG